MLLDDPSGLNIQYVDRTGSGLVYAALLNSGNLILANSTNTILWDSFSYPTDTILPTQILRPGIELVARYSKRNYSGGRFKLKMQEDGDLVLYSTAYQADYSNTAYWRSDTKGSGYELVFNETGQVYLTALNESIIELIHFSGSSTDESYQRVVLENDGVFMQYVYPKSSNTWRPKVWTTAASKPIPGNICLELEQSLGSGPCGFNTICTLGNDQRPTCNCPPQGYVWLDPEDQTKGCRQDFAPQSCDISKPDQDKFELQEMINTDWPRSDYEMYPSQTEDWCRQSCLSDCFCAVAIYGFSNCWKKRIPLSNGKTHEAVERKALIKVRKIDSTREPAECQKKDSISKPVIIIGSTLLSGLVLLNLLLVILAFATCRRLLSRKMVSDRPSVEGVGGLRNFTFQEISEATDGFKEELGRGAFGTVYKGFVSSSFGHGGHFVAVKVLHRLTEKGDIEFKREMKAISQTNHKNLVKLQGYCNEEDHRILVYEYMSNSCLANFLFRDWKPSWHKRVEIAQGVARGLSYLHDECGTQMIHCDIKPQNVLLDDSLVAKISDFGLAKLLVTDQTRTMTELRGTRGYVAPEWFRNMAISAKVDVYSFGVLLLELICCRKNYKMATEEEPEMILVEWVSDCYHAGSLDPLVLDDEEATGDMNGVERFVRTALWCIQEDPSQRPTMKKVSLMLEGAIPVPIPPDPCSFIS
ncbi:hypothetical protein MLD38_017139 [Melastoma candidum]|uniref:Uncharacterized protein n=1 Tax=Melastoma candidum TaxID=119954 RepID=A0ACB9QQX8_9MYRT|nr:hypothetical protein MLD38_017139 [Melastoma candidum]